METKSAMVLVVDDDADFVEITRHVLEGAGYRVEACYDSEEAWSKLDRVRPDLVITDLMMTALDSGFGFARRLKEDARFAKVPVILATSVTRQLGLDFRPQGRTELSQMQVDAYFDKPIPPARLLTTVKELLSRGAV